MDRWASYLSPEDYETVVGFVNDSANGVSRNDFLLLHGTGNNGKTTMVNDIVQLVGEGNCTNVSLHMFCEMDGENEVLGEPDLSTTKLAVLHELDDSCEATIKQLLSRQPFNHRKLHDVGTKYVFNGNVIAITNAINFSESLLERATVAHMTHVFKST